MTTDSSKNTTHLMESLQNLPDEFLLSLVVLFGILMIIVLGILNYRLYKGIRQQRYSTSYWKFRIQACNSVDELDSLVTQYQRAVDDISDFTDSRDLSEYDDIMEYVKERKSVIQTLDNINERMSS